jgi:hypothetical protein
MKQNLFNKSFLLPRSDGTLLPIKLYFGTLVYPPADDPEFNDDANIIGPNLYLPCIPRDIEYDEYRYNCENFGIKFRDMNECDDKNWIRTKFITKTKTGSYWLGTYPSSNPNIPYVIGYDSQWFDKWTDRLEYIEKLIPETCDKPLILCMPPFGANYLQPIHDCAVDFLNTLKHIVGKSDSKFNNVAEIRIIAPSMSYDFQDDIIFNVSYETICYQMMQELDKLIFGSLILNEKKDAKKDAKKDVKKDANTLDKIIFSSMKHNHMLVNELEILGKLLENSDKSEIIKAYNAFHETLNTYLCNCA